jgi:hypothetical protein
VVAAFDDTAFVEHDDLVGVDDGRQPVGDDQAGAAGRDRAERRLDRALRQRVERRGRLVEQEDLRALQDEARDGDPLALAAR